ncbi:hypothetical protein SASPL_131168 [Salvia splendens]|uniref:Protein kinase domain-containing protein n=1 Tax=Salvia splendens TaxID=180675 RepID=A0A8X8X5G8_SALSN|nr:hypothetical protein SASPL_131168 [Salvia splendens]
MYMVISNNLIPFLKILASSSSRSNGQQQYSGNSVMNCEASDEPGPSPAFLYSCNAERPSCKSMLMFRTRPTYSSASSIANLTSSDPQELAHLNNITAFETLPPDIKCACPSEEQISNGTRFLFTFLITWHDSVANISKKFKVSAKSVAAANGFATEDPIVYPFTTILIPLQTEPQASKLRWFFSTSFRYAAFSHTKPFRWISVEVGAGAALAVFCFLTLLGFLHFRRVRAGRVSRDTKHRLPEHFLDKVVGIGESLKIYKYEELEAATDNFSQQRRLSESIYHGILRGNRVAVKKTSRDISKEIKILGNLNHFNLINLYETSAVAHSWNHRILIALDVAKGLDYLHNCTSPAYVHKDINSCNILLNRELSAKITNFSLAGENEKSHSGSIVGGKGYMALEYVEAGEVSPKIDIYAFGVVLLELITGREAVLVRDGEESLVSEVVISAADGTHKADDVNTLVDPRLQVKHPLGFAIDQSELALRLLKLCAACLAPQPTTRLSMGEVVNAQENPA